MSTRILIGVAVVMAVAAGGFLAGWFPNRDPSPVAETGIAASTETADPFLSDIQTADSEELPGVILDPEPDDEQVLSVRIANDDYFIARSHGKSREYRAATLEEVVSAAQDRPGNDQGVRVRVVGTPASKSSGERSLREALLSAGIDPAAIEWAGTTRR